MITKTVQAEARVDGGVPANADFKPSRKISKQNSAVLRTVAADPLYDVYEVAAYLGVDHTTVRSYIERGRLEATRPGGKLLRVSLSAIQAFLYPPEADQLEQTPAQPQPTKVRRHYVRPIRPEEPALTLSEAWDRRRAAKGRR